MNSKKQSGHIVTFTLFLISSGIIVAYLFRAMSCFIPVGGPVPYVFVSFFIFPIGAIWPLLKDLTALQETNIMTQTEISRLASMVTSLQNYLKASALILLLFGLLTGVALYLVVVNALAAKIALSGIGFFVGSGICIFVFMLNMWLKIQNYKAKVIRRAEELKQRRKLLKKSHQ